MLIPEINKQEVPEIARVYSGLGIEIMNIIPLIPLCEMSNRKPPTCEELQEARIKSEPYIRQFRKCQQCRADAVGVPGKGCPGNKSTTAGSEYFHG